MKTLSTETIETQLEIFSLVLAGGDGNKKRAHELIKKLDVKACRELRAAAEVLDGLTIDAYFDRQRDKRMNKGD